MKRYNKMDLKEKRNSLTVDILYTATPTKGVAW